MWQWKRLLGDGKGQFVTESALLTAFVSLLLVGAITLFNIYSPEIHDILNKLPQAFAPF